MEDTAEGDISFFDILSDDIYKKVFGYLTFEELCKCQRLSDRATSICCWLINRINHMSFSPKNPDGFAESARKHCKKLIRVEVFGLPGGIAQDFQILSMIRNNHKTITSIWVEAKDAGNFGLSLCGMDLNVSEFGCDSSHKKLHPAASRRFLKAFGYKLKKLAFRMEYEFDFPIIAELCPQLEELDMVGSRGIPRDFIKSIGLHCPKLHTLKNIVIWQEATLRDFTGLKNQLKTLSFIVYVSMDLSAMAPFLGNVTELRVACKKRPIGLPLVIKGCPKLKMLKCFADEPQMLLHLSDEVEDLRIDGCSTVLETASKTRTLFPSLTKLDVSHSSECKYVGQIAPNLKKFKCRDALSRGNLTALHESGVDLHELEVTRVPLESAALDVIAQKDVFPNLRELVLVNPEEEEPKGFNIFRQWKSGCIVRYTTDDRENTILC